MVAQLNENLAHKRLEVTVTEDAKQWILDKACRDKNYGARPLRRAIQRYIEDPLSEALIQGQSEGTVQRRGLPGRHDSSGIGPWIGPRRSRRSADDVS